VPPLEELVKAANARGGLASVPPTDFMPPAAPRQPEERLVVPPALRRDLRRVIALDVTGYVDVPADLDALIARVADARLRVTLEDAQDHLADQLLSRTPGAGSHALAVEVAQGIGAGGGGGGGGRGVPALRP